MLRVVFAVLAGYGITGDDAVDATRALRGFLTLEAGGGFGMPRDIDRSYQRFITASDAALANWAGQPARPAGGPGPPERQRHLAS